MKNVSGIVERSQPDQPIGVETNLTPKRTPHLRVESFEAWADTELLQPAWDSILADNSGLTSFSSREWLGSWWAAFGQDNQLMVLTCNAAEQTVAIAPFFRTTDHLFGKQVSCLQLVGSGSGDSEGLDLIVQPGYEDASLRALLSSLENQSNWDVCSLETLAAHSPVCTLLPIRLEAM